MEGVADEAASLAGHLGLGKLIYLYDQNDITLAGTSGLSFTEDVAARFEALGWHTQTIDGDGHRRRPPGARRSAPRGDAAPR